MKNNIILGAFFVVFCFATYQLFGLNKSLKEIGEHVEQIYIQAPESALNTAD